MIRDPTCPYSVDHPLLVLSYCVPRLLIQQLRREVTLMLADWQLSVASDFQPHGLAGTQTQPHRWRDYSSEKLLTNSIQLEITGTRIDKQEEPRLHRLGPASGPLAGSIDLPTPLHRTSSRLTFSLPLSVRYSSRIAPPLPAEPPRWSRQKLQMPSR